MNKLINIIPFVPVVGLLMLRSGKACEGVLNNNWLTILFALIYAISIVLLTISAYGA